MDYLLVKLIPCKTYLSLVDPNGKSRFACFSEKNIGDDCIKYVSHFKFKYGVWPILDMSENRRPVEPIMGGIIKTRNEIERDLELEFVDYSGIDRMSMRSNVSFFCILDFKTSMLNGEEMVAMSGQEMDGNADDYMYRKVLNEGLNVM
jgi:hypothetical protein